MHAVLTIHAPEFGSVPKFSNHIAGPNPVMFNVIFTTRYLSMAHRIENLAPDGYWSIKVDKPALEKDLAKGEYSELLDGDDRLDTYEVLDRFGLTYVPDEVWIRVYDKNTVTLEFTAHDILKSFLYFPNQFEGIDAVSISKFIGLFAEVAGGQGGGFALIDSENGEWIFSTREFSVQSVLWIPSHSVFVCLYDVATYAWHTTSIVLIRHTGELTSINLYSHDHFKDKQQYDPGDLAVLRKVDDAKQAGENRSAMVYSPEEDLLHLYLNGHWTCSFQEIVDLADFQES